MFFLILSSLNGLQSDNGFAGQHIARKNRSFTGKKQR